MVTAIVVRELLIQGLRSHLEGQGQAFGAKMAGKLKTRPPVPLDLGDPALPLEPPQPWPSLAGSATS